MNFAKRLSLLYRHCTNDEVIIRLEDFTSLYNKPPKQLVFKFYKRHRIKLRACLGNPLIFNLKK